MILNFIKNIYILLLILTTITCKRDSSGCSSKEIINEYKIEFDHPPSKIPVPHSVDAPLLGNGYTGVSISGPPEKQVYYLARNDFWRLKSSYSECFPAVLGKAEIDIPALSGASYKIVQYLHSAETFSSFSKPGMRAEFISFVSATDDFMIIEISNSGASELKGNVRLLLPGVEERRDELAHEPPCKKILEDISESGDNGNGIYWICRGFEKNVDICSKAACAFKILQNKTNSFNLKPGKKIKIVFSFSSDFKSEDCLKKVIDNVLKVNKSDIKSLEKDHKSWWADFWSKSFVFISDKKIEKHYYLSNYALACSCRDKNFPPGIFGTWITKEIPFWSGDYHLNYNHMAPYYGLYSSNHIEQADSYNAPVLAMQERGEYYSEKITGIKGGILLPVGIGPIGMESTRKNTWVAENKKNWINEGYEDEGMFWGQKSNSAYCVVNMSMQFYHTYDKDYINRVYPFVKGVATFWENYLVNENGINVIYNDAVHEGSHEGPNGNKNSILSLGLVRLVFQTAIDMSIEIQRDGDLREKWTLILKNMADYPLQKKKGKIIFRYTEEGPAWFDSNTIGIHHIYPAGQIGLESDPKLLEIAKNTMDIMNRWTDFNGSNSFFPAAVRIGYDPKEILKQLHKYIENTDPNGFEKHNPHGIENLSTVPNTINEMLCISHQGIIKVFPVWPMEKDACFHQLRTYGAFLVSSEITNGIVSFVRIHSEKGKTCFLENPWKGEKVTVKSTTSGLRHVDGDIIKIDTKPGEDLLVQIFSTR